MQRDLLTIIFEITACNRVILLTWDSNGYVTEIFTHTLKHM